MQRHLISLCRAWTTIVQINKTQMIVKDGEKLNN
jgi:hypothetical protein